MAKAREMAEESAPYDSLPAYAGSNRTTAGAGPDQCWPHWHHIKLPSGQMIRTNIDCHVGADAMVKDNIRMQVDWGGNVPVTLDMRTKGDVVHGVATIHLPGVGTPVRTTLSLNWREIYNVLRKRGGGTVVGQYPSVLTMGDDLGNVSMYYPGGEIASSGAAIPTGVYTAALAAIATLAALAGATNPGRAPADRAYMAALAGLGLLAAFAASGRTRVGAQTNPDGAYAAALAGLALLAAYAGSKPGASRAYGAALTALALLAVTAGVMGSKRGNPDGALLMPLALMTPAAFAALTPAVLLATFPAAAIALGPLAAMAANPASAAALVPLAVTAAFPALGAITPLAMMIGTAAIAGADLNVSAPDWQGAAFNVTAPDMNVEIHVGAEDEAGALGEYAKGAAMTTLAAMVAAAGIRGRGAYSPKARALGDGHVGGSAEIGSNYQLNVAATALAAMAAFGVASLAGDDTETLIAGGGAFDLLTKAKTIARSDVIKNLNRLVRKSLSNPLIRQAMQLDQKGRAQFALKVGARVYGRAVNGDPAARRAIKLLHEHYKKGSRFAARALRLMNLGRQQYYGAKISGNASTDNLELIGACVEMPASLERKIAAGADAELELLLEAATGVGAWEGIDWIADRLKGQPMTHNPNLIGAPSLLLAGRRAQAASYIPGRL